MSDNTAPETTTADNTAAEGGQDQNAPVQDYGEILARHQHELAQTGKTVQELRAELEKSHGVLGRVQKAFAGDEGEKLTPYQKRMQEFDELASYLDSEALESQKRGGQGLPITTKIGKQLAAYGKEAEARAEKLEAELAEIKATLKRQNNPAFAGLERAAFAMEGMVDEALSAMYGAEAGSKGIRAAQFNAVTARINEEIKDLMANDPEALLKVQRNPKIMRRMVNHFMAEMLPPKVRTMMDEERIKAEPIDARQLWQAFAEARGALEEARGKGNEKEAAHYSGLMDDIRRDILSNQIAGRKGGTVDKPSLNQLFSGMVGGR